MRITREHARYAVDLRVDCATRDAFVSNYVTNLSRGGLFIRSDHPLPVSAEVDLTLTLPDSDTRITARGRVVWNYDIERGTSRVVPGMGIKLLDIQEDERRKLAEYLEALPSEGTPVAAP